MVYDNGCNSSSSRYEPVPFSPPRSPVLLAIKKLYTQEFSLTVLFLECGFPLRHIFGGNVVTIVTTLVVGSLSTVWNWGTDATCTYILCAQFVNESTTPCTMYNKYQCNIYKCQLLTDTTFTYTTYSVCERIHNSLHDI